MTKGELRKARKKAVAEGHEWNIELSNNGCLEIIRRTRTKREEQVHRSAMDKWARRNYETEGHSDY